MALRLLMIPLFLAIFYQLGLPIETLILFGLLLLAFILLRGHIWKSAEHALERFFPFVKQWPEWAQKIALFVLFIIIYLVLKQIVYALLALAGIDLQTLIENAVENQP